MHRPLFRVALCPVLASVCAAQTTPVSTNPPAARPPEAPELRLTFRGEALGGALTDCIFDASGAHMLTVGGHQTWTEDQTSHVNLAYWNMATLKVVAYHEAPLEWISSVALHPGGSWAILGSGRREPAESAAFRLDLTTGELRRIREGVLLTAAFDAAGSRVILATLSEDREHTVVEVYECAQLDGGPIWRREIDGFRWRTSGFTGPDEACVAIGDGNSGSVLQIAMEGRAPVYVPSPWPERSFGRSGSGAIRLEGTKVRSSDPESGWTEMDLGARSDSWLELAWACPDGTWVIIDVQQQLHHIDPATGQHRVAAAHPGCANGLAWSPDGRFLAVQSMAALRVFGPDGKVVAERSGPHGVLPGDTGPEFVLFDHRGITRWNAAVGTAIGDTVPYRGGRPSLVSSGEGWSGSLYGAMRAAPAGDAWICAEGTIGEMPASCVRITRDGAVHGIEIQRVPGESWTQVPTDAISTHEGRAAMIAWKPMRTMCGNGLAGLKYFGSLRSFDAQGELRGSRVFERGVDSVRAIPNHNGILARLTDGRLLVIDETCGIEQELDPSGQWHVLEFVGVDRAIGIERAQAFWLDTGSWQRTPLDLPDGVATPSLVSVAPGGRRIALARGADVWVVALR